MFRHTLLPLALLLIVSLPSPAPLRAAENVPAPQLLDMQPRAFFPLLNSSLLPERTWDPRLDLRGAVLIPAQPASGQGYWRLVTGVWYAENEPPFAGQHHIFADALDPDGSRRTGLPLRVTSADGGTYYADIWTELKPGDLYAANFAMYAAGPSYRISPFDGNPADAVTNLGMGSIEAPLWTIHTSYGFTWQWIAP